MCNPAMAFTGGGAGAQILSGEMRRRDQESYLDRLSRIFTAGANEQRNIGDAAYNTFENSLMAVGPAGDPIDGAPRYEQGAALLGPNTRGAGSAPVAGGAPESVQRDGVRKANEGRMAGESAGRRAADVAAFDQSMFDRTQALNRNTMEIGNLIRRARRAQETTNLEAGAQSVNPNPLADLLGVGGNIAAMYGLMGAPGIGSATPATGGIQSGPAPIGTFPPMALGG